MVRRRYTRSRSRPSSAIRLLIGAGLAGGAIGLGSVATTPEGRGQIIEAAEDFSVSAGLARERAPVVGDHWRGCDRSEEHTSELQSLMRSSYAVFCLKKKKNT